MLTVLLSPPSIPVTSVVDDIQPVTLTLTLVNNDSAAADVSGGLMIEFTADPGVQTNDGTNGPLKALLASNFTADPYLTNADGTLPAVVLEGPGVTGSTTADTQWSPPGSGNLSGAILVFTTQPNGTAQYMLPPGASITFTFSGVVVDTIPGASTITVTVQPSLQGGTAATIGAQPQIQKASVSLQYPVVTATPPVLDPPTGQERLNPPASETKLSWSNDGAGSCELDWNNNSTVVTYNGAQNSGWKAPLMVPALTPATATLLETDAFTVIAYGTGGDGTSPDTKSATANVTVNPPEFTAITVPPVVTGIGTPSGDPAGGQQITIIGLGFTAATAATIAVILTPVGAPSGTTGKSATSVTVVSDTEVTALTPPGTGLCDVTITTPVGTSPVVPEDVYSYAPAGTPIVTGVSPSYGSVDGTDQVTIAGAGLAQASTVEFGANSVSVTASMVVSDSTLTVPSPAGAGVVDIAVTAGSVTSPVTPAGRYTYIQPAAPIVTGVVLIDPVQPGDTPPQRPPVCSDPAGGQLITITGTGLTNASAVTFVSLAAGSSASATGITVVSDTEVTATTPPGAGVVDIIVTAGGQDSPATPADRFSYGIQAGKVAPYQPFQLIWSCYQGWNRKIEPQFTGDSAGAPNDPDTIKVTGDTTPDAGRAIVSINRGVTFTLTLPPGTQTLANLPVSITPVELSGFTSTAPLWDEFTGWQYVELTWVAVNVVGFSLTQNGSSVPQQPSYDQRYYLETSLPLSGPVTYALTAYGYDSTTGTMATQIQQSITITPLPVSVSDLQITDLQVIDASTGAQRVTLSWRVNNAAQLYYEGGLGVDFLPPGATSLDLDLPLPPPTSGPVRYDFAIIGEGYVDNEPGRTNEATTTIIPYYVQLNSFTASAAEVSPDEQVTLTWSAEYATGFTLEPGGLSPPATVTSTTVKVFSTTTYTLTALGYPAGPELPYLTVTVSVIRKFKEDSDKLAVGSLPENQPTIPGGPLPADAGSEPPEPAPGDQVGGQRAFISPDERPDVGAPPPPGMSASS